MAELTSYLLAQARRRPLAAARFTAFEFWRRGRIRSAVSLAKRLPAFSGPPDSSRWSAFLPATARDAAAFRQQAPAAAQRAIEQAERIMGHEFEVFGERVPLGKNPDWHRDWQTGHRWPVEAAGKIKILQAPAGADVKRLWELGRFHHFLPLGKAFALTGNTHYSGEFAQQVLGWLADNPYPRGIHWAMPMEAAIRSVNWCVAAMFFFPADLPAEFWREFLGSLFLHGRFLYAYREWNPVARSNHYLACVIGLLHLGVLFRDLPEGARWLEFSRRALREEMAAQVGPDGVAHEGSSGYHVFVTELFLTGALLLARLDSKGNGSPAHSRAAIASSCGEPFAAKLEKMFEFCAAALAGRKHAPLLGDNDDGRLLPFCSCGADSAAHLLATGSAIAGRGAAAGIGHDCEEPWWRTGIALQRTEECASASAQPGAFPSAGFYFFTSRRLRGSMRCGPLGVSGWANHAHGDQLSVEFCCNGRPIIVDPGTYLYSGDAAARNQFRSTRAHNSVVVDGMEQNRFWPGLLFRMLDDTRSRVRKWEVSDQCITLAGEHSGYERLPQKIRVERRLVLDREHDTLVLCDTLTGHGSARLEWNFQLAPDINPASVAVMHETGAVQKAQQAAWIEALAPDSGHLDLRSMWRLGPVFLLAFAGPTARAFASKRDHGWVSPRYGKRLRAPVIRFSYEEKMTARVVFVFAAADEPSLREMTQE